MVVDCNFVVKEVVTGPFEVKDQRNKPMFLRPLSLEDNVGQLVNISRNGMIPKRLERNNVWIVKDFLDRHSSNARELQRICGIKGKAWKTTVNHAKTCLTKNVMSIPYTLPLKLIQDEFKAPVPKECIAALDIKLVWEGMEQCQNLGLTI